MNLKYEEIKPKIGARILNTKEELLKGDLADGIRELLEQRGVVVFPTINFTDEEQVAFTKTLGNFAAEGGNHETVHNISLDTTQTASAEYLKGSMYWHIDGTMERCSNLSLSIGRQSTIQRGW